MKERLLSLFTISGRIGKYEFITAIIRLIVISILIAFAVGVSVVIIKKMETGYAKILYIVPLSLYFVLFGCILHYFSISIRRAHDRGTKTIFAVAAIVLFGPIYLLINMFSAGEMKSNEYGEPTILVCKCGTEPAIKGKKCDYCGTVN